MCRKSKYTFCIQEFFSLENLPLTLLFPALVARRMFGGVVKLYIGYSASNTQSTLLTAITYRALRHVSQQLY